MAIKGAKTIAEYAIRKWLQEQNFDMSYFRLEMEGKVATLRDNRGDSITLEYDSNSNEVAITG